MQEEDDTKYNSEPLKDTTESIASVKVKASNEITKDIENTPTSIEEVDHNVGEGDKEKISKQASEENLEEMKKPDTDATNVQKFIKQTMDGEEAAQEEQTEEIKKNSEEQSNEEVEAEQTEQKSNEEIEQVETVNDQKAVEERVEEEEEQYVEEPPPDPTAPYNFTDSQEALKPKFELRPDQLAEVEQLWELYQAYTPAYTDIKDYITEKELVYMLNALLLMTYTPEQLQELIAYCVRPPHPQGHISYEQFLKMVTMRQREFPIEEELRSALQVFDTEKSGSIDREYFKEVLSKQGHKLPQRQLDNLIKEVDISNNGTIGIEDVVGTMCIDLNKEDLLMLMASLNPPEEINPTDF